MGLLGIAAVLGHLASEIPREIELLYDFGPSRAEVREAVFEYLLDGELIKGASFRYAPGRAPAVQSHRVSLSPGRYRLNARLTLGEGEPARVQHLRRAFVVPAEGAIRVDLFDMDYALRGNDALGDEAVIGIPRGALATH